MNRIKVIKDRNYTVINNTALRDIRLSLKAKGFFAMIMSLPEDWDFTLRGISKITKEGREALSATIAELIDTGYCHRERVRDEGGRLGYNYTFTETPYMEQPYTENPCTVNPQTVKPQTENHTQISKEELSTERLKKERRIKENKTASAHSGGFDHSLEPKAEVEEKEKSSAKKEKEVAAPKKEDSLHHQIIAIYSDWYADRCNGIKPKITAADAAGVKTIISVIKPAVIQKQGIHEADTEAVNFRVEEAWAYVLNNWHLLSTFLQEQVKLAQIASNLTNILPILKNGRAKQPPTAPRTGGRIDYDSPEFKRNLNAGIEELRNAFGRVSSNNPDTTI